MALISCPECGREVSDKANACPNCGYPIEQDKIKENKLICPYCGEEVQVEEGYCSSCGMRIEPYRSEKKSYPPIQEKPQTPYTVCPSCGFYNNSGDYVCRRCGHKYKIDEYNVILPKSNSCPSCGSSRVHAFVEEVVIRDGKTKSKTTVNLNPLKPFTVFNHKEKVVRKPITKQVSKFVCDDCGNIFQ